MSPTWVLIIRNINLPEESVVEFRKELQAHLDHALHDQVATFTINQAAFDHHLGPPDPSFIHRPSHNGGSA